MNKAAIRVVLGVLLFLPSASVLAPASKAQTQLMCGLAGYRAVPGMTAEIQGDALLVTWDGNNSDTLRLQLVIDNGVYATTGAMKSATASGTDIAAVGRAAGIAAAERVADTNALATTLARATRDDGPFLIVAEVEPDDPKMASQARAMPFDIVEAAIRFRRVLEERGLVPTIWAV